MSFKAIIGLEVHVELKTKSKMFCECSTDYFGKKPNTYTCPVCLGLPGVLPVPNKTAIEWCVMLGMALNCKIPLFSKFDRKNYFYPDLPKGYQISQYDQPFCVNGNMKIGPKSVRIKRVHMEEDTGKLIHEIVNGEKVTLIDFNRSGVPLIEIVTEPDFESAEEVKKYLQKLQQVVRHLGISDADMEKGQMRLEPNISIKNSHNKSYRVEVKNINSFNFVTKAINYELERQIELLKSGKIPLQETRGWDERKQKTMIQRVKEEASDYRYFPEPDIPPIRWKDSQISYFRSQIPELPDQRLKRFKEEYTLSDYNSGLLIRTKELADYYEETVKVGKKHGLSAKQIANFIINKKFNIEEVLPAKLIQNITVSAQKITIDEKELKKIIDEVLRVNEKAVSDFKKGKKQVIMFLIGETRKRLKERVDMQTLKEIVEREIKKL